MAVVVLTGCSSGFGLAGALAFARNGDTVFATMRDTEKSRPLQDVARKEHLSLNVRTLDVTRAATFSPFLESVVAEAGSVDVLVNNAGILRAGALEDVSEASLRLVMETNCIGPLLLTRAVLPQMRKQRSGCVIMVSSLSGVAGLPGDVAYSASKFALEGATEALRHEVDRWGIRLALIEAGLYATGIFDQDSAGDAHLPGGYPPDSVYRPLIEKRLTELRNSLPGAFSPTRIAELMVTIANADGSRLRWPADDVAKKVLRTLFAQDDAARDQFLRKVAGSDWWSAGKDG